MALTIVAPTHGDNCAAYTANNAIIEEVTSDRDSDDAVSVTGVTNSGGFVSYTVASHTFLVNDVITAASFSTSAYNVDQTVSSVTATTVVTNVVYVANGTGTITRNNNNFKVKGTLYIYNGTELSATVSNLLGFVVITTGSDHGYTGNEVILITGSTYHNGVHLVSPSVTSTTFALINANTGAAVAYIGADSGYVNKATTAGTKFVSSITESGVVKFRFNFANMVQSYTSHEFLAFGASNTTCTVPNDAAVRFSIKFQEYFDNVSGLSTAYQYLYYSKSVAHNTCAQIEDSQNMDTSLYVMATASRKFLTDAPSRKKIRVGEEEQLSFATTPTVNYKVAYEQFNTSGASLGVAYLTIQTIRDRAVISVNSTLFGSSHSRVDVWLVNSINTAVSEPRRFDVDTDSVYNSVRIFWLNRKGGFDAYTFKGNYASSLALDKEIIQTQLGSTFNIYDQSSKTINVDANNYIEVFSNFENAAHMAWLKTLITSPLVYYYDGTNRYCINSSIREMKDYDKSAPQQLKFIFALPKLTIQNQ